MDQDWFQRVVCREIAVTILFNDACKIDSRRVRFDKIVETSRKTNFTARATRENEMQNDTAKSSPWTKKSRGSMSNINSTSIVFFDHLEIIHKELVSVGQGTSTLRKIALNYNYIQWKRFQNIISRSHIWDGPRVCKTISIYGNAYVLNNRIEQWYNNWVFFLLL